MGAARGGLPKDQRARGDSHHTRRRLALAALVAVLAIICGGARTTSPALAAGEPFRTGDLFQSGGGYIRHINPTFWDIGSWTPADGEGPTSMAFDADGNLYASVIAGGVVVITSEGFYGGLVVEDEDAGALAVDSDGNIFVAVPSATIRKYDPGGSLVDSYTVATGSGSTQATSLAIAADDCTLFYTNDDTVVRRYNVCTETQLSNLGSGITTAQVVRLTPDGDVLVSDVDVIHLFDVSSGDEIETYGTPSSGVYWRSVAVEADGEHFWAVNGDDEDFHRFDVDTADETIEGSASIGEGGTGNDFVIYTGPDVPPDETISYYVSDLDENETTDEESIPYLWGCEVRRHHKYGAVILFFGQPWSQVIESETVYGTNIFGSNEFRSTVQIESAVHRFLRGYAQNDPPQGATCVSPGEQEPPYLYLGSPRRTTLREIPTIPWTTTARPPSMAPPGRRW
jgi:streptogramin lyase